MGLYYDGKILFVPTIYRTLIMKGYHTLSKSLSAANKVDYTISILIPFYMLGHIMICSYWTNFASMGWDQFGHDVWSSSYVAEFALQPIIVKICIYAYQEH